MTDAYCVIARARLTELDEFLITIRLNGMSALNLMALLIWLTLCEMQPYLMLC